MMTHPFEKHSYEENPIVVESEEKTLLKILERNKSPGVDVRLKKWFQTTETETCQNPNKNMPTNMENKTTAYSPKTLNMDVPIFKKGDMKEGSKSRTFGLIFHEVK